MNTKCGVAKIFPTWIFSCIPSSLYCPASTNYDIIGLPLPRLGGNSNNGDKCGGFARNFNNDASNTNWNRRGRETIFRDKKLMGEDLAATVRNHTMEFY